eukprot:CAMPEP_0116877724 /NCGR_PEP_ID=MMETSP0463-20121206/9470_1 /TAXON_ID=181622 /ORGANISM="Strombidinopsis sp, Strain SopsisLIS2011" /LENGTH=54 /DNA_ID=CAMNT_0004525223 /DNA_START=76 /DNA_END=237 /DNA_ORIENTATION=+
MILFAIYGLGIALFGLMIPPLVRSHGDDVVPHHEKDIDQTPEDIKNADHALIVW